MIDKDIIYKIGLGGIIDGELMLISPSNYKERAMLSRIEREHRIYKIDREFVSGTKFPFKNDPSLNMWVFPLREFTIYELRNYVLEDGEIIKTSYICIQGKEVIELEYEQILVFMQMLSSKGKYYDLRQNKKKNVPDKKTFFAPDDIEF